VADALTIPGTRAVWAAQAELGEGTLWSSRQQAVYWVDILNCRVMRYTPASGQRETWQMDEFVSAVAETADPDELLVALRHDFVVLNLRSGALRVMAEVERERPLNRFNDGGVDAAGRFWCGSTDFDCEASTGALYRMDDQGRCERVLDDLLISNGPVWSLDGHRMYITETGRKRIDVCAFDPLSGTLGDRRPWLSFEAEAGYPDGMAVDAEGNVWIAHFGGSCVSCHDGEGRELKRIRLPASQITRVAFGGADLQTLYASSARVGLDAAALAQEPEAGALFEIPLGVRGVEVPRFGTPY